jgi:hypothetical protein
VRWCPHIPLFSHAGGVQFWSYFRRHVWEHVLRIVTDDLESRWKKKTSHSSLPVLKKQKNCRIVALCCSLRPNNTMRRALYRSSLGYLLESPLGGVPILQDSFEKLRFVEFLVEMFLTISCRWLYKSVLSVKNKTNVTRYRLYYSNTVK